MSSDGADDVELISIFGMDFSTSAINSLFWMNKLSRWGIFGEDFFGKGASR
jgi:hypothetical protein